MPLAEPAGARRTQPAGTFVNDVLAHFDSIYRGPDGLFVTAVTEDGGLLDPTPVLPDLGDILPFLWVLGRADRVEEQLRLTDSHLRDGLVARGETVAAFDNHDFLLGLVEVARLSRSPAMLEAACRAARELHRILYRDGIALREARIGDTARLGAFRRTSPFNGGYIELYVDLARLTGDAWFLEVARREARIWLGNPFFRRHGLFRRVEFAGHPRLGTAVTPLLRGPLIRLFKDNTNLVHALLALEGHDPSLVVRAAIEHWMDGFRRRFLGDGGVPLHLDRRFRGDGASLKAAFSAIDLLCDAHAALPGRDEWLAWAARIADFWLAVQWENGLFPLVPGVAADHLDANTDMVVALSKLAARTEVSRYRHAADRCAATLVVLHRRPGGHVLAVDPSGGTVDGRVFVKYQGLLLKLHLLARQAAGPYADPGTLSLLRDR